MGKRIVVSKDLGFVERADGDNASPEAILGRWVTEQQRLWTNSQRP